MNPVSDPRGEGQGDSPTRRTWIFRISVIGVVLTAAGTIFAGGSLARDYYNVTKRRTEPSASPTGTGPPSIPTSPPTTSPSTAGPPVPSPTTEQPTIPPEDGEEDNPPPETPGPEVVLQKRITGTGAFAGKCLDVRGPSIEAGTPVQTWTCSNVEEMKWLFDGDGPIKGFGGNCATVAGAFRNGTPVEMHPCDGSTAQRWIGHGNGFIEAGSNMCLDIQGPLLDDGTPVQVWECDDSLDQHHWVVR